MARVPERSLEYAEKSDPSLILLTAERVIKNGGRVVLLTDFDETQAAGTDNPQDTIFDPDCARAVGRLRSQGVIIGLLSGRAVGQVEDRWRKANIEGEPYILGTFGKEMQVVNESGDAHTEIAEDFKPYADAVTGILHHVRRGFLQSVGLDGNVDPEIEATIEFFSATYGPLKIYTETKGLEPSLFPEGLSISYNFNDVKHVEARKEMRDQLVKLYDEAFDQLVQKEPQVAEALAAKWGTLHAGEPEDPRYSYAIEPNSSVAKGPGAIKMLYRIQETLKQEGVSEILVMYEGDANPDAAAMNAIQEREAWEDFLRGKRRRLVSPSMPTIYTAGIWVRPPSKQYAFDVVSNTADLHVVGVKGNAAFLNQLADAIAKGKSK